MKHTAFICFFVTIIIITGMSLVVNAASDEEYCKMAKHLWESHNFGGNFLDCTVDDVVPQSGRWKIVYLTIKYDGSGTILPFARARTNRYRMEVRKDDSAWRNLKFD